MDLFSSEETNLIPFDGELFYFPSCFSIAESELFEKLDTLSLTVQEQFCQFVLVYFHLSISYKTALYSYYQFTTALLNMSSVN